jgi:hypothetical protein
MSIQDRLRLAQMNHDLHGIRIVTYDTLIDALVRRTISDEYESSWLLGDD